VEGPYRAADVIRTASVLEGIHPPHGIRDDGVTTLSDLMEKLLPYTGCHDDSGHVCLDRIPSYALSRLIAQLHNESISHTLSHGEHSQGQSEESQWIGINQ
jgi:hypothetical protein